MIEETHLRRLALNEFNRARRRANLSQITDRLIGRPDKLIPFETIRAEILQRNPRSLGLQQVPLDRIIGSVGRYREFNRQFLPLDDSLKERWVAVDTLAASRGWPPVNLYKIGETYYVDDGNHRVSVGRQLGNSTIEAYVMEFSTEAVIRPDQTHHPILTLVDDPRIISCTAINKTFNTAGLHCSNIIINDQEMRDKFKAIQGFTSPTPFAIVALIAAYNEGEDWLQQVNAYIDDNLKFLDTFLKENMPQVKYVIPEGTYIGWLDFRGYGLTSKEVHDRIYNQANVVLEDGEIFGPEGEGFQRICVPTPRPLFKQALERIAAQF